MMRRALVAALLAAALALVACGGETRTVTEPAPAAREEPPPPRPTKAELIRKADRICAEADRRFDRAMTRSGFQEGAPNSTEVEVDYLNRVLVVNEWRLRWLRALSPPPDQERIFERYLSQLETLHSLQESDKEAVIEGDRTRSEALLDEQIRVDRQADGIAQGFGFRECGARS